MENQQSFGCFPQSLIILKYLVISNLHPPLTMDDPHPTCGETVCPQPAYHQL